MFLLLLILNVPVQSTAYSTANREEPFFFFLIKSGWEHLLYI